MKSITLRYNWRVLDASNNALLKNFGDATGVVDYQDEQINLNDAGQVMPDSTEALLIGLKRALVAEITTRFRTDLELKELLAKGGWKPDVTKLNIVSIKVS